MRHRIYGKHLGRDKNQRTALFRGLVRSLLLHEAIITTEAKAKSIKGLVDNLVSDSLKNTPSSQQKVASFIVQEEVIQKLTDLKPKFAGRTSGFTTLVKMGKRAGDGAMLVKMSLVNGKKVVGSQNQELSERVEVKEEKNPPTPRLRRTKEKK